MATIMSNESFYETTITAAITASQNTIPVTVLPNITASYLVIEANTSNREIIYYTGYTGTAGSSGTLTGVVRGLATYGSDASAGTGKAHPAGTDIANKDVHYYYSQYYDFLMGTSGSGANVMRIGDGNTISAGSWLTGVSGRFWYVNTSSLSAFWGLSSNGQFVCSENGVDSYVVSAGGSGVTGGDGLVITAGVMDIDKLSSGGLRISATKLAVNPDWSALKNTSAGELYYDPTVALTYTGANTFSGINTFSGEQMGLDVEYADADEVIVVSSHPKPVKLTSAGRVYMCSSSCATSSREFYGFAITAASAAGTQIKVKTKGLVDGFTGLTPGYAYYAAGPAGELVAVSTYFATSASPSTELKLGLAATLSSLVIDKTTHWEFIQSVSGYRPAGTAKFWLIETPTIAKNALLSIYDNNYTGVEYNTVLDKNYNSSRNVGMYAPGASATNYYVNVTWSLSSISLTSSGNNGLSCTGTAYFYT